MQLEEIGDDLIRRTNSLVMRLTKIKTNTGLRIRAAVQNEFIETKIATLATKKIDASHLKIENEGKFLGVLKRKQILGNYFKSTEKDDEIFIKKVNLYLKLNENLEEVINTIKEAGFPAKLKEKNSQFLIVKVPPPSRMQLEEIGDDLIRRTNSLVMRLTKIKTNTGLRIRAAVQNEFIEAKIATLATKKIDATYLKVESEGKFLGVLKRKQILGNYFQSTEKDDEIFIKKVNLYLKLNNNLKQKETVK